MTFAHTISLVRDAFAGEAFTAAEARARGIGPDRLERAVRAGVLRRLRRGVYSLGGSEAADAWDLAACRARRLQEAGVPAVIAGTSASHFWDLPIVDVPPHQEALKPTLYVDPSSGVRAGARDGMRIVHAHLAPEDLWESPVSPDGSLTAKHVLLCMPLRTAVDVTRHLRLSGPAAVAALSAAQRRHAALLDGCTPVVVDGAEAGQCAHAAEDWRAESRLTEQLRDAALRDLLREELLGAVLRAPRRGLSFVRDALPLVDPRLETALEAISWTFMCRAGLPRPSLQEWVTGASGKRYRVDFFWSELGLVGEADGAVKYRVAADVMSEKQRHSDLLDAGLVIVRWTWRDAWSQVFLARLGRAM